MALTLNFHRMRTGAIAIGALGLVAFAAVAAPRLAAPAPDAAVAPAAPETLAQRQIIDSHTGSEACGAGAYVSGDLAGDVSPMAVYMTMCGRL